MKGKVCLNDFRRVSEMHNRLPGIIFRPITNPLNFEQESLSLILVSDNGLYYPFFVSKISGVGKDGSL